MAEVARRTYQRDAWGPQAVRSKDTRDSHARTSRRHDDDDNGKQRSRHSGTPQSSKRKGSGRRQSQAKEPSEPQPKPLEDENPTFELRVVRQPKTSVPLGSTVEQHVIVSVIVASSGQSFNIQDVDPSCFFAVTSLVADTRDGERVALETGYLVGQHMLGSVRSLPEHVVDDLLDKDPSRHPLGFFSFPDLYIRQHGTYRIRTTLVKMGSGGATSLHAVDSEPVKVETPLTYRCNQRL